MRAPWGPGGGRWGGGGSITDLRSLLPPVCLLTAALPLALVPRNCDLASPGRLLLPRRASGCSSAPRRVHAGGRTSVPLDPAALLPALRCHVKRRQGSPGASEEGGGGWGDWGVDAFCLLGFPVSVLQPRGALKRQK